MKWLCCLCSLLFLILTSSGFQIVQPARESCAHRSCYPATGNLLIGRERQLTATSTCGLRSPQHYCIVSHLEEPAKCFICDSRSEWVANRNERSHLVENVVTRQMDQRIKKWWQSENGVQNVSLTVDFEAEFHFTHLIITFKTFRPAAMLIERSSDFGKTWKVYRYFAYDCAQTFPDIPTGPLKNHNDVVCDSEFSDVSPSHLGEVIFKALPPELPLEDPYALEIRDLLRVTNLRINFTRLHTLGDNLMDSRKEVSEKYYYAIYDMVVRGSCSCYGHASRCIPVQTDRNLQRGLVDDVEMVHGRCECTHYTKGLNCEECEDFYNDLPWKPAMGDVKNECKRCECHNHASACHFDWAVYVVSGNLSGGVCDDCRANTMGRHCETCKPYFYRPADIPKDNSNPCRPCNCFADGSENFGICDSETNEESQLIAGRCRCKANVAGGHCDRCEHGFWNLTANNPDGCEQCACVLIGTVNNEGCDKRSGECRCKQAVVGEKCDTCIKNHWGLSRDNPTGCEPCNCDIGASKGQSCEPTTGQCNCKPGFGGRTCTEPDTGHFCAAIDYYTFEAEYTNMTVVNPGSRAPELEKRSDMDATWTGLGYVRVYPGSQLTFTVSNIAMTNMYNIVLRYESRLQRSWEHVTFKIIRPGEPLPESMCANSQPQNDIILSYIPVGARYVVLKAEVCFEVNAEYKIQVTFGAHETGRPDIDASILIDSLSISPPTKAMDILAPYDRDIEHFRCRDYVFAMPRSYEKLPEQCQELFCAIGAAITGEALTCDCDPTGSLSSVCEAKGGKCDCKPNVIGRRCDMCRPGTFGFGPQGCTECNCTTIGSKHLFCNPKSGQCVCTADVTGRQCSECEIGHWNYPQCESCQCNGHADTCDQKTGFCIDCRDLTTGPHCARCKDRYYGDPRLGVDKPCKECKCPGEPSVGPMHADTCYEDPRKAQVVCNCKQGYAGDRCDRCLVNWWGNPNEKHGSCEQCQCYGNIDVSVPGSCNEETGRCQLCLHHTEGFHCENCEQGWHGDAKRQSCQQCRCNEHGWDNEQGSCNKQTGQCPCHPNVVGLLCDHCADLHFNFSSGVGCEPCDCDVNGVTADSSGAPDMSCGLFDGQCSCIQSRGGRQCNECRDYMWGNPEVECKDCDCHHIGSLNLQCDRRNGQCECLEEFGGLKCAECARGYTGEWPSCQPCGECFTSWDDILHQLRNNATDLIEQAKTLENQGVTSVFEREFAQMDKQIQQMMVELATANITGADIKRFTEELVSLGVQVNVTRSQQLRVDQDVTVISERVDAAEHLNDQLDATLNSLHATVSDTNRKVSNLRASNVHGAYNMTVESMAVSERARSMGDQARYYLGSSEKDRLEAGRMIDEHTDDLMQIAESNKQLLTQIEGDVETINKVIPSLSSAVCGGGDDELESDNMCHAVCGGPLCEQGCGGAGCSDGAVAKATIAESYARESTDIFQLKQGQANRAFGDAKQALHLYQGAQTSAKQCVDISSQNVDRAIDTQAELESFLERCKKAITNVASMSEIRTLAETVLNMTSSLNPADINNFSSSIQSILGKLSGINLLLEQTAPNRTRTAQLREDAEIVKDMGEHLVNATDGIRNALASGTAVQSKVISNLDYAAMNFEDLRDNFKAANNSAESVSKQGMRFNEEYIKLHDGLDKIRREYTIIDKQLQEANKSAAEAETYGGGIDATADRIDKGTENAQQLLEERKSAGRFSRDGESATARASVLNTRSENLLERTQQYTDSVQQLRKELGSSQDRILSYQHKLPDLLQRMEAANNYLNEYNQESQNCRCDHGAYNPADFPERCRLNVGAPAS